MRKKTAVIIGAGVLVAGAAYVALSGSGEKKAKAKKGGSKSRAKQPSTESAPDASSAPAAATPDDGASTAAAGESADELKRKGNAELKLYNSGDKEAKDVKQIDAALAYYTAAIAACAPNDKKSLAIVHSNRSAAYLTKAEAAGGDLQRDARLALADACSCIELNPTWHRGYSRKSGALERLSRPRAALEAAQRGIEVVGEHETLRDTLNRLLKVCLKGPWHGKVSEEIGGYEQMFDWKKNGRDVEISVLGKEVQAKYTLDSTSEPYNMDIRIPGVVDPNAGAMQQDSPPVPYIFEFCVMPEVREAFERADSDGSGTIDRDELRELLKTIAKATAGAGISAEGIDDKMVDASMSELDADGNGEVSLSEFQEWYAGTGKGDELRLCCPHMTMERPTSFSGAGLVVMRRGRLGEEEDDDPSLEGLDDKQKTLRYLDDFTALLPTEAMEPPTETDSEAETAQKLLEQVKLQSKMHSLQKRYGDQIAEAAMRSIWGGASTDPDIAAKGTQLRLRLEAANMISPEAQMAQMAQMAEMQAPGQQ